jgi:two-component system response regulator HydG
MTQLSARAGALVGAPSGACEVRPHGRTANGALTALIVDDEPAVRDVCRRLIEPLGFGALQAADGVEALERLEEALVHLVLLDLRMPRMSGIEVLPEIRRLRPDVPVIVVTAHSDVDAAVEAMKLGAADFITKPFAIERLRQAVSTQVETRIRPRRIPAGAAGRPAVCTTPQGSIVGAAPPMLRLFDILAKVAPTDATVLIQGESGTGKELVARALHVHSPRAREPFIPVDCGAINPNLIASELFGHVKGAFTGAHATTQGLLRTAGRGTVFLDEVSEIPLGVQATLLRALQEMEVRPVGGPHTEPFRARILAATNRDLAGDVAAGRFRQDLYYRLNVVRIVVPPLRDRREDIPLLVQHFLDRLNGDRKSVEAVAPAALERLRTYRWPGNVRELENVVERMFTLASGGRIDLADLPSEMADGLAPGPVDPGEVRSMPEAERDAIAAALQHADGNKRHAARLLKIGIATLYRKMKQYGLMAG